MVWNLISVLNNKHRLFLLLKYHSWTCSRGIRCIRLLNAAHFCSSVRYHLCILHSYSYMVRDWLCISLLQLLMCSPHQRNQSNLVLKLSHIIYLHSALLIHFLLIMISHRILQHNRYFTHWILHWFPIHSVRCQYTVMK